MGHQKERKNGHHLLGNLLPQLAGLLPQRVHSCTQNPNPKPITGTLRKLLLLPATPHQKSPNESTIWQRLGAQITRICQRKRNRNEGGCGGDRKGRIGTGEERRDNGDKTYVLYSVTRISTFLMNGYICGARIRPVYGASPYHERRG